MSYLQQANVIFLNRYAAIFGGGRVAGGWWWLREIARKSIEQVTESLSNKLEFDCSIELDAQNACWPQILVVSMTTIPFSIVRGVKCDKEMPLNFYPFWGHSWLSRKILTRNRKKKTSGRVRGCPSFCQNPYKALLAIFKIYQNVRTPCSAQQTAFHVNLS